MASVANHAADRLTDAVRRRRLRTLLLPRRMAGTKADDDPCCERNHHEKCERPYDRGDQPADIASVVATGR